jgi:hypothetical protein
MTLTGPSLGACGDEGARTQDQQADWQAMRPNLPRTVWLIAAAGLLAACTAGADAAPPTWVPQPSVSLEAGPNVSLPNQPVPPRVPGGPPVPGGPGQTGGGGTNGRDPNVVATGLTAPTGLALLPDGSALVGERTTGRIVRVQPVPGRPVPTVRVLPGLATSGDGGLLDLAVSPSYTEDGLIYAYVTTATDNRVIDFTLDGPSTPVLTGIPKGATANTGRLMFDDGDILYVGTGDAGRPRLAADPNSLAGKVLRIDAIGHPAEGQPEAGLAGLQPRPPHGERHLREPPARHGLRHRGPGRGKRAPPRRRLRLADGQAGLAAGRRAAAREPVRRRRMRGGRRPDLHRVERRPGAALGAARRACGHRAVQRGAGPALRGLLSVVAAPDGALWLTTTNRDGHGAPVADDERVLRIIASSGGSTAPV